MSDGAIGSAITVGNPVGDAPAGNGAVSQPAATPPAAPLAAPAPTEPPAAPAQKPANWYDGISDQDLLGYVQNKGWKDPADLANGYRNLEKLVGVDKIPMPKDEADAEGWNRVYDRLGRPTTAADYKLPVPEGMDGKFAEMASGKFHELGLTAKQGQALAEWWNQTQGSAMEAQQQQMNAKAEADMSELRQEWGQAFDENIEFGRRAAREYGLDEAKLSALENALGTSELMKLMVRIGRSQGEAAFVTGESKGSTFGMTPAAAQQRIAALRQDPGWTAKYLNNDAEAKAEMSRLMSLAYPE